MEETDFSPVPMDDEPWEELYFYLNLQNARKEEKIMYSKEFLLEFQNVVPSNTELFNLLWKLKLVRGMPDSRPIVRSNEVFSNKENRDNSNNNSNFTPKKRANANPAPPSPVGDLTPHKIEQRLKQIEFGYRSIGYIRYISLVPKDMRATGMPMTPRVDQKVSKRIWDNEVRQWRRDLHKYDPDDLINFEPDRLTLEKIFGKDVDIQEAVKLLHEKEVEYKNQLKIAGNEENGGTFDNPSGLGYDVRGMPIKYVPGKAAEAAKKVEWHASKVKKEKVPPMNFENVKLENLIESQQ